VAAAISRFLVLISPVLYISTFICSPVKSQYFKKYCFAKKPWSEAEKYGAEQSQTPLKYYI
jgi:hypothetical protein